MLKNHLNSEQFRIGGEFPILFKLRLRKLFGLQPDAPRTGRVLVIDTCLVGDFMATLPALRSFIQSTSSSVDLIVSPALKSLAESIKGVHTVHVAPSIYERTNEKFFHFPPLVNDYDLVLVLRISPEAYRLLSGIHYSFLITYHIPTLLYFAHILWATLLKKPVRQWRDVNYDIVRVTPPAQPVDFNDVFSFSDADFEKARALPELRSGRRRILIHTGSGWQFKLWDNGKWAETLRIISACGDFDFIFVGAGETEAHSFDTIQGQLEFKIYSLINKIDLKTLLLVMRLSDYFIGIDSGPRNMAHMADLRSITLLAPALDNFKPWNPDDIVINKFTCRCKSLFYLHKESELNKLSPAEISDAFQQLITPRQSQYSSAATCH